MRHLLWVGSNIEPRTNVPRILLYLREIADPIFVSRIIETEPIGMVEGAGRFLNFAVMLDSELDATTLKHRFEEFEIRLGRDRSHPDRKRRNRPADLDLLATLPEGCREIDSGVLPAYPFMRAVLLEFLAYLGIKTAPFDADELPDGVRISVGGNSIGERPTRLLGTRS